MNEATPVISVFVGIDVSKIKIDCAVPINCKIKSKKDMRQQETNRLEAHRASAETTVLPNVKSHIAWLDKQIAKPQGGINDHIDGHPELKADAEPITGIPGIWRGHRGEGVGLRGRSAPLCQR